MNAKHETKTQEINQIQTEVFSFDVFGLWCSTCSRSLEESFRKIPGVVSASVNFESSQANVSTDHNVSRTSLEDCATKLGYSLLPALSSEDDFEFRKTKNQYLLRLAVVTFASMWTIALSLAYYSGEGVLFIYLSSTIAIPGIFYGMIPFLKASIVSLKSKLLSFDLLLVLANLSLFTVSVWSLIFQKSPIFFDSIIMTISVVLWARYLEVLFRFHARSGLITSLRGTLSDVLVLIQGQWVESVVQKIRVGRSVRFLKNQIIALDGQIESEFALFDLSFITGESNLVRLSKNALVRAGSILKSDAMELKVTAPVGQRWIDSLYLNAIRSKTDGNRISSLEKILSYWIPSVLVFASLAGVFEFLFTGEVLKALYIFSATLLVTCPCSLVLAEPLSRLWLKKTLSDRNIQMNSSHFPKNLEKMRIIFDKTGTLASKHDYNAETISIGSENPDYYEEIIRSCCYGNPHPTTISLFLNSDVSTLDTSGERILVPGAGVIWKKKNGDIVRFGKSSWITLGAGLQKYQSLLEVNSQVSAGLLVSSSELDTNLNSLRPLAAQGHKLAVISGDKNENCEVLKKSQLFDFVMSESSPEDKKMKVRDLKSQGQTVVYVGDGINDVLAMAESDLSIAIRSEIAATQSVSHLVISENQIEDLSWVFAQLKIADQKQSRALKFGLLYNVMMVPLAVTGMLHPLAAVFAMTASSLLVTATSLYSKKQVNYTKFRSVHLKSDLEVVHT